MPLDALAPICRLPSLATAAAPREAPESTPSGFGQVLNGLLGATSQTAAAADAAVADLAAGNSQDLHTVSLAVAQADLTFRLLLELRNRLTEGFQEISRMQV